MAQYKGIKEILKKFWSRSKDWISKNYTKKTFKNLTLHTDQAESGRSMIMISPNAVNIYFHKDGCSASFEKMPTEGHIEKDAGVFSVALYSSFCIVDSRGTTVDVSWYTDEGEGEDQDVIDTLKKHINDHANPHQVSADNIIDLATVAKTGSYNHLTNKPDIPTETTVSNWGFTKFSGSYNDLENKPDIPTETTVSNWGFSKFSGNYNDLSNKPTVDNTYNPTSTNAISGVGVKNAFDTVNSFSQKMTTKSLEPSERDVYSIGSKALPYLAMYSRTFNVVGENSDPSITANNYAILNANKEGSPDVEGIGRLVLGNNKKISEDDNATGNIFLYNGNGVYTKIAPNADNTSNRTITLPGATGILALKSDIPTEVTEQTVSDWGFTKNTGNYNKPTNGIPKTDLDSSINTSLSLADSSIQSVKTINGNSITGTGNIEISTDVKTELKNDCNECFSIGNTGFYMVKATGLNKPVDSVNVHIMAISNDIGTTANPKYRITQYAQISTATDKATIYIRNGVTTNSTDLTWFDWHEISYKTVRYDIAQSLTDSEKAQARANIGASNFSGDYNDLSNKPTIPEAQVQSDWEATEGIGVILNKPTLGTAAAKNYTSSISSTSTNLPTSKAVYSYIDGLGIKDTTLSGITFSNTASATAAKTANMPGFSLSNGQVIIVYFYKDNTATNPTLNINETGAVPIYISGSVANTNLKKGYYWMEYDGTNWNTSSVQWSDTTYEVATNTTLGIVKSSTTGTVAGKDYNVEVNSDGTMKVNVPWVSGTDTKVQTTTTSANENYPIIINNGTAATTNTALINSNITVNPSTGNLNITKINGVNVGTSPKFTDTTYEVMVGATTEVTGTAGLVPAPPTSATEKFLRGDGNWATPTKVKSEANTGGTALPILLNYTTGATTNVAKIATAVTVTPSSGTITATNFNGTAYKIRTSAPSSPANGDIWIE